MKIRHMPTLVLNGLVMLSVCGIRVGHGLVEFNMGADGFKEIIF